MAIPADHEQDRSWAEALSKHIATTDARHDNRGVFLASGSCAEVFAWDEQRVLKLFRKDIPESLVKSEGIKAAAARAAGIRTPAVLDIVALDGRYGILF